MTERKKQQWIMVMNRNKHIPDREWGMEVSYSIDHLGFFTISSKLLFSKI